MSVTDFVSGGSNIINSAVDMIIFWRNWDTLSQYLLLGAVLFLIAGYWMFKTEVAKSSRSLPKRSRSRSSKQW